MDSASQPGTKTINASPHRVRELALQVLFAFDSNDFASTEVANEMTLNVTTDLILVHKVTKMADAAWAYRKTADEWATRLAPQWPSHRQPAIDRSLIRLAIWELTNTDTPPKVVIDEAIELAKAFSTANSPAFLNGVLDAVLREMSTLKTTGL